MRNANPNSPLTAPLNSAAWQQWREAKLAHYPTTAADLIVEVADPYRLTTAERTALSERICRSNMALYATNGSIEQKALVRALAAQMGLQQLDRNYLADDDGISSIEVSQQGEKPNYIPYTNRPISWHCDGYYNRLDQPIQAMVLHCVRPAAAGGENRLLDPELLWLLLREASEEATRLLLEPDIFTIPEGLDGEGQLREASVGPVFRFMAEGALQMRYSARSRNVSWRSDSEAARCLIEQILAQTEWVIQAKLEAGMGLICNNVLHTRTAFGDSGVGRLLYRARYRDRLNTVGY